VAVRSTQQVVVVAFVRPSVPRAPCLRAAGPGPKDDAATDGPGASGARYSTRRTKTLHLMHTTRTCVLPLAAVVYGANAQPPDDGQAAERELERDCLRARLACYAFSPLFLLFIPSGSGPRTLSPPCRRRFAAAVLLPCWSLEKEELGTQVYCVARITLLVTAIPSPHHPPLDHTT
jgi:hypothetical protein